MNLWQKIKILPFIIKEDMELERVFGEAKPVYLLVAFLTIGILMGYAVFALYPGEPKVGVIKLSGVIEGKETADRMNELLVYAEKRKDIRSLVIEIESPGGEATASEEVYLKVLSFREKKPVVASIESIGASGAYFIAAAADYIIAKPSSNVGSIGVRAGFPKDMPPDDDTLTSGPLKKSGFTRKDFIRDLEIVKQAFIESVMSQRGDRLRISMEEISKAGIYIGVDAKRFGLVDELGSNTDAHNKAAELAGLKRYSTVDLNKELNITFSEGNLFMVDRSIIEETNTAPVYYFIYINPG